MMSSASEERLRASRELGLGLFLALLMAVLVAQLFSLQVVQHRRFLAKSLGNMIQAIPMLPPRGQILDRAGRPLAVNRLNYTLRYFPPPGDPETDGTLRQLAQWLRVSPEGLADSVRKQRKLLYSFQPVTLATALTLEQVAYIEENRQQFPGCLVDSSNAARHYPLGAAAAHLVGYTALMSEEEFRARKLLGYLANEFVGKEGVEKYYEGLLHGALGERDIEVDRDRCFKRVVLERPPTKGRDIYLTIDSRLQVLAFQALEGRRGAVIVMCPRTGEVLALASSPSYDPNRFRAEDGSEYLSRVVNDQRFPMLNRAVGNGYPPGSVVKPAVMMGALEMGAASANSTFYCAGKLEVGNRSFNCWQRAGHGTVGVVDAIGKSCDVAFYHLGLRMGAANLRHFLYEFGFGEVAGIDLPQEAEGLVPSPEWKRRHYSGERYREVDRRWYDGDTANLAIGQGYLLATPLQVLMMVNTIAADGITARPTLLKGLDEAGRIEPPHRDPPLRHGFRDGHLRLVQRGMRRAALLGGTAETLAGLRVSVAGKTGTAEVWRGEPHSWFAGYFPANDPQVSLVVFVENGGSSATTAVPAAKQLIAGIARVLEL